MEQITIELPYIEFPIVESFNPVYTKLSSYDPPLLIRVDYILRCGKSNSTFKMACRLLPDTLKTTDSKMAVVIPCDESNELGMDVFINFKNLVF